MSTDEGLQEAPYTYHISLNFQDALDEDLKEVFDKWHGRSHVLKIDHMSPGAFAAFRNSLLLIFLFLISAIADAADAGICFILRQRCLCHGLARR